MENNEYLFSFEKLTVWNDARDFITEIYGLTDNFPFKERFGLSSQIQKSRSFNCCKYCRRYFQIL